MHLNLKEKILFLREKIKTFLACAPEYFFFFFDVQLKIKGKKNGKPHDFNKKFSQQNFFFDEKSNHLLLFKITIVQVFFLVVSD